ncbi:hypothetical protein QE152_g18135 [Popillia japonica]|uniref:Uncharacterized protein n=1 Tax=Popillia japonica TaxID=7064 RepID=A0AAW1L5L9_POPJA
MPVIIATKHTTRSYIQRALSRQSDGGKGHSGVPDAFEDGPARLYHVNQTGVRVTAVYPTLSKTALQGDARKRLISGKYKQAWKRDTGNTLPVKNEFVAKSMVDLIRKAPCGSSWLIENFQAPKEYSGENGKYIYKYIKNLETYFL